ncbi:MAG: diaminopimelate decarboxylase [Candidatus Bipolaricaulaceae bacterium]
MSGVDSAPLWLWRAGGELVAEGVPIRELAERFGTPLYLYSAQAIERNVARIREACAGLPLRLFYAVKANSNGAILRLLCREGLGAEVVSQGELVRALWAGFPPDRLLFTGPGKQEEELRLAAGRGIYALVVESLEELELLKAFGKKVRVALRLNLGLAVATHPGLATSAVGTKFGLDREELARAMELLEQAPHLELVGLHTHLGSQISQIDPYLSALSYLKAVAEDLQRNRFALRFLDLGGGFALDFPFWELACRIKDANLSGLEIYFEPGRAVVGNAGCLIARVLYTKTVHGKNFVIVDAAMNDLLRPALYGAKHPVWVEPQREGEATEVIIAGPVCESTDTFGVYTLPPLRPGDFLVFLHAGAYGFSMASQYNSRPRPAEVLLFAGRPWQIRAREEVAELTRGEEVPEWLSTGG